MVRSSFAAVAVLALMSHAVGAVPTVAERAPARFSFANWVEEIIANPDGALSPEEAVVAFYATANNTLSPEHERRDGLQKRARCYEQPNTDAYLPDAVACINQIASRGGANCPDYALCVIGHAAITADGVHTSSCNDCARGAGFVLDACTRPGSQFVEGSEYAYGNGNELIRVRAPG
ncbi:hypothetical protein V8F06_011133 [Rhypophila decipiens]